MFSKRPAPRKPANDWLSDLILGVPDKTHHEWGKGHKEFGFWIERLTEPGALVVDPFVGGGTVPVACKATGRCFVGTELDPGVAAAARARCVEIVSSGPVKPISPKRFLSGKLS